MAQQRYDKGIPFQTSSWAELSDEWKWEGRELTGTYLPLCGEVDVGTWLTLYANETEISGMWKMNKHLDPVKVYLIGDSGSVSVDIYEYNECTPLADSSNKFSLKHSFTNLDRDSNNLVSCNVYYQDPTENPYSIRNCPDYVQIELLKDSNTTITKIYCASTLADSTTRTTFYSNCFNVNDASYSRYHANSWTTDDDEVKNLRQYGLSVFFTSQGILTYNSNKNTVNPKLRN